MMFMQKIEKLNNCILVLVLKILLLIRNIRKLQLFYVLLNLPHVCQSCMFLIFNRGFIFFAQHVCRIRGIADIGLY